MNKILQKISIGLFLVFSLVVLPSLVSAQANPPLLGGCTNLVNNMWVGKTDANTNGEVTILQNFYKTNGFGNIVNVDGIFGQQTRQATIAFQTQNGIVPPAGFVGQLTRTKIAELTCPAGVVPNNPANPNKPTTVGNLLNQVKPLNQVNQANPANLNKPNVLGLNPNPVNPLNPVVPVNPATTNVVPVPNPNNPLPVAPCVGPGVLFNVFTGLPCPPNPVNPVACTPASLPSITVLSPNGGETIVIDTATDIKWTSCNVVDTVRLSLVNQTNVNPLTNVIYPLLNQTGNDGFETVKITQPAGMPAFQLGTRFKIRIDVASVNAVGANPVMIMDDSDNFFTIN